MRILVRPRTVTRALAVVIAVLGVAGLVAAVLPLRYGVDVGLGMVPLFALGGEANAPTWYSASALLLASLLLAAIAVAKRQRGDALARHWRGLALLFLYLSFDEAAMFHDRWRFVLEAVFGPAGDSYIRGQWVPVAVVLVAVVGFVYWPFLTQLPARTRRALAGCGLLYVGSAAGLEVLGRATRLHFGVGSAPTAALSVLEEVLEMVAILLFIAALLEYIAEHLPQLTIGFAGREDSGGLLLGASDAGAASGHAPRVVGGGPRHAPVQAPSPGTLHGPAPDAVAGSVGTAGGAPHERGDDVASA